MHLRDRRLVLPLLTLLLYVAPACSGPYFEIYRNEISANQRAVSSLRMGISASEVRSTMGEGEIVKYKKIYLIDPWRSEAFSLVDGTEVLILYYVTQPPRKFYSPIDRELTPVVLENDRVVGWGWTYLRRNTDRYRTSIPREQL